MVNRKMVIYMSSAKMNGIEASIMTTLSHLNIVEMIIDSHNIQLEVK